MVNKVVIAAAGRGKRMLSLTDDKPKHLIEVSGKPFLFYVLDNLFKAGYREIIIVAGYKKELVEKSIKNYTAPVSGEFTIKFADQNKEFKPEDKYGTACPLMLKEIKNFVGNEQFLFISGDNLFSVEDLKAINIDDGYNYVAGLVHDNPEKYGVLIAEGNLLKTIIEKPKEYAGNLVNVGLYKFTYEIFNKVFQVNKSPRGEYELTDAVSLLAEEKKVRVIEINNNWLDFGEPKDIEKMSKFLEDGNNKGEQK
ncbi:MAG: sugar phosphate nucleotidyltransferase [Candidatus Staskawiczbacteria bacterium]|nr:sugar phosphate nucleotidyltransferase [Candidatus Staskawiczbacteria bacterium]